MSRTWRGSVPNVLNKFTYNNNLYPSRFRLCKIPPSARINEAPGSINFRPKQRPDIQKSNIPFQHFMSDFRAYQ